MARKYLVKPEFEMLRPIVMSTNLFVIWVENLVLAVSMFLALGDPRVKITKRKMTMRDGHGIKAWVFTPKNAKGILPAMVYYPGGGFMMGPNFAHKRNATKIAFHVGCKIVLFPYRLAPKYAFPTGLYDAEDCFRHVHAHAREMGIDPNRIALGGDSAGGTLTAGTALLLRDKKGPKPCFAMMLYPALDKGSADFDSRKKYTDTPMFNTVRFAFIEKHYYKNGYQGLERYAFPLENASFSGLPDAYIETAQYDCLHDDGVLAAKRLREAGKAVTLIETKGTFHAYDAIEFSPVTIECMKFRIAALKKAFGIEETV